MHSRSWAREFIEVLLILVIFTLFVRTFVVAHINVPTPSMVPAVLVGDHILVNRFVFAPHRETPFHRLLPYRDPALGDVVVLPQPDRPRRALIKRVVALPCDSIAIDAKQLHSNGAPVDDPPFEKDYSTTILAGSGRSSRLTFFSARMVSSRVMVSFGSSNRKSGSSSRGVAPAMIRSITAWGVM